MKFKISSGLCVILLFLSCVSCDNSTNQKKKTPTLVLVKGVSIPLSGVYMRYPFRIRQSGDHLYIMDLHGTENFIHKFTYPIPKYCESIGKCGNGPKEFLDAENIRLDSSENLWVLDANQKQLTCLSFDSTRNIPLSEKLVRTLDFDFYQDSLFIVPDYTGAHRFSIINSKGQITESFGRIPIRENKTLTSQMALAQAWRSFIDYNPENGILAMVTQLGEVLELYNLKDKTLINIHYGNAGEPVFKYKNGISIPNGIMGYSDVYVGKRNVYALFWGHSLMDIRNEKINYDGGNQIHIFDLHGKHISTLILDRNITGFYINEGSGYMLGVDPNRDQPLFKFSIPTII